MSKRSFKVELGLKISGILYKCF